MEPPKQPESKPSAPRKMRFAPKAPPRRAPKPVVKTEVKEENDDIKAKDLLLRLTQASAKAKLKVEKKDAPSQVAFGYGGASPSIRSFGIPSFGSGDQDTKGSGMRVEKQYQEPWDYYSNYPVSLPLRRPYSGNPEHLDEEEFGGDSEAADFNENLSNSAADLGLMEENVEPKIYFLQLPPTVPIIKQQENTVANEASSSLKKPSGFPAGQKTCSLKDLPEGFMGKMLVYKSGAVKMKLGDMYYNVTPGTNCSFAQDVVVINTSEKHCCVVGELNHRAHMTPDVDSVLESILADSL